MTEALQRTKNERPGEEKGVTAFEIKEEKLIYDARNLIALAVKLTNQFGYSVTPQSLISREEDGDGKALCRQIAIEHKNAKTS